MFSVSAKQFEIKLDDNFISPPGNDVVQKSILKITVKLIKYH